MPSLININGIWRENKSFVNINGVLREADSMVNINGIWREASNTERVITEEDIKNFVLSYKLNKKKQHDQFPWLSYNKDIPASISLTGDISGEINLNEKGIEYQYDRHNVVHEVVIENKEEGIKMYESHLYAILQDDTPIDVCCIDINENDSTLGENKITNLKIEIQATLMYEANGYYMAGWNSICNKNQFIITDDDPRSPGKSFKYLNQYKILPVSERDPDFQPLMQIGIARDLTHAEINMVGSYGILDQTIHWISVNGIKKPFIIGIY